MKTEYFVYHCVDKHVPKLDNQITFEEISKAIGNLKEGKSTYDGWIPSMISRVSDTVFPIIYLIFNTILMCRIFPSKCRTTLVAAIFKKKGTISAAKIYRPISLVHILAKLFNCILLDRFKKWFKPDDQQTAYQQGRCTADHIFLLRCLISWVKKSKSKLFIVCIDFDGAFDRISRHTLFKKLSLFGSGTIFISYIITIYTLTDNILFHGNYSACYHLISCIKQGLPFSPLLILFYVNDIFDYFKCIYSSRMISESIHILMHADGTTLLASDRSLAENKLRSFLIYCRNNKIL